MTASSVSNKLAELERLLAQQSNEQTSSIDYLLATLPPQLASMLRMCAIPHEFDESVVQALDPALDADAAEACFAELATLSCVTVTDYGATIHDASRQALFVQWLLPEHVPTLRTISARLCDFFAAALTEFQHSDARASEIAEQQLMYHELAAYEAQGFARFEAACRRARSGHRFATCGLLIKLAHEYDSILQPRHRAWLAYHEGKLTSDLSRYDEAQQIFDGLLAGDIEPVLRVKSLLRLGSLHAMQRRFARAAECFSAANEAAAHASFQGIKSYDIARSLGEAYRDDNQLDRAEALLNTSLAAAVEANDIGSQAETLNSLGTLHARRGDQDEAIAAYRQSVDRLKQLDRRFQSAQVYNNLGIAYADHGDWELAEEALRDSLGIKKTAGDSLGQAKTLVNLARVHRARDQFPLAITECTNAAALFKQLNYLPGLADTTYTLAQLHRLNGSAERATALFAEAATCFEAAGLTSQATQARAELDPTGTNSKSNTWFHVGCALTIVLVLVFLLIAVLASAGHTHQP